MPVKKKQKKLSTLKKDLWKLFALYQKLRYSTDGETVNCYTCNRLLQIGTSGCHAGHCLSKAAYSILYFEENAVRPQCYYCNVNLGGNEYEFNERLKIDLGEDVWQEMYDNRHQACKRSRTWYEDKILEYQDKLKPYTTMP